MFRSHCKWGLVALYFWIVLFCANLAAEETGETSDKGASIPREQILVLGKISDDPKKHYQNLKPMADYAAARLNDAGIVRGEVLLAKTKEEMIGYVQEGKVDWVTETAFAAILIAEETGAEIALRKWKKGVPDYSTVFVARKDSPIQSLKDLQGKTVAFEDSGSTTAYFLPLADLRIRGLSAVRLENPRQKPPADKVGYVFAGGELNITTWVFKGLADAGAYSNLDWEDPTDAPEAFKKELRVFYESAPFPRAVELFRKDLRLEVKERLKQILLQAPESPEGRKALETYEKTEKFDNIEFAQKGLDEVRYRINQLRDELK